MPLSNRQRKTAVRVIGGASEEYVRRPLWEFHPYYRPLILSERLRRGFTIGDDQAPDPEYH